MKIPENLFTDPSIRNEECFVCECIFELDLRVLIPVKAVIQASLVKSLQEVLFCPGKNWELWPMIQVESTFTLTHGFVDKMITEHPEFKEQVELLLLMKRIAKDTGHMNIWEQEMEKKIQRIKEELNHGNREAWV